MPLSFGIAPSTCKDSSGMAAPEQHRGNKMDEQYANLRLQMQAFGWNIKLGNGVPSL